jgi:hypothetical protein
VYARKDEYEDPGLPRCDAVLLGHVCTVSKERNTSIFKGSSWSPQSLKTKEVRFSEMPANAIPATRRPISEVPGPHRFRSFMSRMWEFVSDYSRTGL